MPLRGEGSCGGGGAPRDSAGSGDPDAGSDWGQEEKGTTKDEMVGWHHRPNGHEFELVSLSGTLTFIPAMERADSFEKTLMLGKIEGKRRRGQQRMRWLDGITDPMDMGLGPRGTPACRGTFGGRRKAVRDRFALQGGTGDFP